MVFSPLVKAIVMLIILGVQHLIDSLCTLAIAIARVHNSK